MPVHTPGDSHMKNADRDLSLHVTVATDWNPAEVGYTTVAPLTAMSSEHCTAERESEDEENVSNWCVGQCGESGCGQVINECMIKESRRLGHDT